MSKRAEKAAFKAYPVKKEWRGNQYGEYGDVNAEARAKYQEGYEQAEKDTIGRVIMWLEEHADEYNGSESAFDHMEEEMITDFRKAMEKE